MLLNTVQPQTTGQTLTPAASIGATGVTVSRMAPLPINVVSVARAPGVVRAVTILWALMVIPTGLATVIGVLSIPFAGHADSGGWVVAPLFALVLWFGLNLRARTRVAWKTQVVLSIIGIFGFPLGTIVNTLIIAAWFSPETKAWFGVDQPPVKRILP